MGICAPSDISVESNPYSIRWTGPANAKLQPTVNEMYLFISYMDGSTPSLLELKRFWTSRKCRMRGLRYKTAWRRAQKLNPSHLRKMWARLGPKAE